MYGMLTPPSHLPQKVSWHQRPMIEWMGKLSGLMYDIVTLYRNTKACSMKLVTVFRALHHNGVIENKSPKGLEALVLTFLHFLVVILIGKVQFNFWGAVQALGRR